MKKSEKRQELLTNKIPGAHNVELVKKGLVIDRFGTVVSTMNTHYYKNKKIKIFFKDENGNTYNVALTIRSIMIENETIFYI